MSRSSFQWAGENNYVLVTHDRTTMLRATSRRLRSGRKVAGLVIVSKETALSRVIDDLVFVRECCMETDMENQVLLIPI